ncbi:MAG: tetratricopeptide repeat-containing serine protease family protein, partial [Verrucomicrobiota bacterium]
MSYQYGQGVTIDEVEAVKWYRKAADQNYAPAQFCLGYCYYNGLGVTQDYEQTVKLYTKAAEQNIVGAQYCLGWCYAIGQGVLKDEAEAVKWYRKAAEQNYAIAQCKLGYCYANGQGVAKDEKEAVKWYRKASDLNDDGAQCNLGYCYQSGQGITKDEVEAVKWYRKAAGKNNLTAELNLGACYANGQGVAQDYVEAEKWYSKAANQGDVEAQFNLGMIYHNGQGVPQNYVESFKWFNLSAAQGYTNAAKYRDDIGRFMTSDQIAEGQKLSNEFKPSNKSDSDNSTSPNSPTASGTGFFITDDGYLISNYHVVKGAAKVRLLTDAGLIDATVVKVDAANDLALLKAVGRFAPLPIAASRTVKLGGTVATVGFPDIGLQGFAPKLAKGEIASLAGAADDPRYFQISLPVQPGNSGGALVDARGNVVGIVAAKLDASAALAATGSLPENVNYAVKSSLLLSFLESVPDVASKIKEPNTKDEPFEDV